jgi:hypothetical protein
MSIKKVDSVLEKGHDLLKRGCVTSGSKVPTCRLCRVNKAGNHNKISRLREFLSEKLQLQKMKRILKPLGNLSTVTSVSNPVYTDTGIPVFGTPNTDTGNILPVFAGIENE